MSKKGLILFLVALGSCLIVTKQAHAASLNNLSDTISTSRPSAASPLGADQAAAAGQADIIDNNAVFLQGDVATSYADPVGGGETTNQGTIVASMSATGVPGAGHRTVYFTNTITNVHHKGDALVVPITAMHTISFKPVAIIPNGGKIVLTFPQMAAVDTNPASPSASAFNFGGLTTGNIQANFSSGSSTCSFAITGTGASGFPSITCTVGTASVASGVTVTILIGCSAHSGASCTTQVPVVINPMKLSGNSLSGQGAATTQADNDKILVQTQDGSSVTLDNGTAVVGVIESVQVQANIDPTLTFQITGLANGTNVSTSHGSGCPSQSTNSGIDANATFVNLGTVGTNIVIAAQDLTVSTNGQNGYSLTATASGQLNDPQNSYSVTSSTTPGFMTAGSELFGIHPCGTDVSTGTWGSGTIGGGANAKVAWPTATTGVTLASRASVANAIVTTVMYAITASAVTPAGLYTSIITYVATPSFN